MKELLQVKPRVILTTLVLILGLVIAMVPDNTIKPYKLTAPEMVDEIRSGTEFISPDDLAHWIITNDPSIQLIDVRTPDDFESFSLNKAINIPLVNILNKAYVDYLDQDVKVNILYSNGTTNAHQAWMILRQLGYENNYVLQGGLNFWMETIRNPDAPPAGSPDDEIARYEFRKGASQFFGGEAVKAVGKTEAKANKPKIKRRKKKKAPDGGC